MLIYQAIVLASKCGSLVEGDDRYPNKNLFGSSQQTKSLYCRGLLSYVYFLEHSAMAAKGSGNRSTSPTCWSIAGCRMFWGWGNCTCAQKFSDPDNVGKDRKHQDW